MAAAQKPPSKKDKAAAKAHFQAGQTAYDAGQYDAAIAEWTEANRLVPAPLVLFNIGQAYRLKGDRQQALNFYMSYLQVDPNGSVSDEARLHRDELAKALQDEDLKRREDELAAERERQRQAEELRKAQEAKDAAARQEEEARLAKERRETRAGIESGKAKPIDGAVAADQGRRMAIADQCIVLNGERHPATSGRPIVPGARNGRYRRRRSASASFRRG